MRRTSLAQHPCSIARSLDVVGEWWTPLILRDVAYGITRFNDLQQDLGISANVLADRLSTLVEAGILATSPYQERPTRHEYALTQKGAELLPALIALKSWGDRWAWPDAPREPVRTVHERCGHDVVVELRCAACGRAVAEHEVRATVGDPVPEPPGRGAPGRLSAERLYRSSDGVRLAAPPRG